MSERTFIISIEGPSYDFLNCYLGLLEKEAGIGLEWEIELECIIGEEEFFIDVYATPNQGNIEGSSC